MCWPCADHVLANTGKSFTGSSLFTNYTGGTNTENIWVSGEDPNIPSFEFAYSKHRFNQNSAKSGFEMCFAPKHLWCWGQTTS